QVVADGRGPGVHHHEHLVDVVVAVGGGGVADIDAQGRVVARVVGDEGGVANLVTGAVVGVVELGHRQRHRQRRGRPLIPAEHHGAGGLRVQRGDVGLAGVGGVQQVHVAVPVGVDQIAGPVVLGAVAGRLDPQHAGLPGGAHRELGGVAAGVTVAAGLTGETQRAVDDGHAGRDQLGAGLGEADVVVHAVQIEGGLRRHLVDDLGDRSAVIGGGVIGAVVLPGRVDHLGRVQVPGGLLGAQVAEAGIDHADLDAGSAVAEVAGVHPVLRTGGRDALTGDAGRDSPHRTLHLADPGLAGQRPQLAGLDRHRDLAVGAGQ